MYEDISIAEVDLLPALTSCSPWPIICFNLMFTCFASNQTQTKISSLGFCYCDYCYMFRSFMSHRGV